MLNTLSSCPRCHASTLTATESCPKCGLPLNEPFAADDRAEVLESNCDRCKQPRQVATVDFQYNIGLLITRFQGGYTGTFCRPCLNRHYMMSTGINLVGWFGVISLFVAPALALVNTKEFISARRRLARAPIATHTPTIPS